MSSSQTDVPLPSRSIHSLGPPTRALVSFPTRPPKAEGLSRESPSHVRRECRTTVLTSHFKRANVRSEPLHSAWSLSRCGRRAVRGVLTNSDHRRAARANLPAVLAARGRCPASTRAPGVRVWVRPGKGTREHQGWLVLALYSVLFVLLHRQGHEGPERGVASRGHSRGWAWPGRGAPTSRPACPGVEACGRGQEGGGDAEWEAPGKDGPHGWLCRLRYGPPGLSSRSWPSPASCSSARALREKGLEHLLRTLSGATPKSAKSLSGVS